MTSGENVSLSFFQLCIPKTLVCLIVHLSLPGMTASNSHLPLTTQDGRTDMRRGLAVTLAYAVVILGPAFAQAAVGRTCGSKYALVAFDSLVHVYCLWTFVDSKRRLAKLPPNQHNREVHVRCVVMFGLLFVAFAAVRLAGALLVHVGVTNFCADSELALLATPAAMLLAGVGILAISGFFVWLLAAGYVHLMVRVVHRLQCGSSVHTVLAYALLVVRALLGAAVAAAGLWMIVVWKSNSSGVVVLCLVLDFSVQLTSELLLACGESRREVLTYLGVTTGGMLLKAGGLSLFYIVVDARLPLVALACPYATVAGCMIVVSGVAALVHSEARHSQPSVTEVERSPGDVGH
jgi:hypothetical protein